MIRTMTRIAGSSVVNNSNNTDRRLLNKDTGMVVAMDSNNLDMGTGISSSRSTMIETGAVLVC